MEEENMARKIRLLGAVGLWDDAFLGMATSRRSPQAPVPSWL